MILWLHLVSASVWVGGLITLGALVAAVRREGVDRSVLRAMARMFGRVSWTAMGLAVATGVFGYGIGEMAQSIGADVKTVGFSYDETINDMARIEAAIAEFKPRMITAVHCETPSGTLNPLEALGRLFVK